MDANVIHVNTVMQAYFPELCFKTVVVYTRVCARECVRACVCVRACARVRECVRACVCLYISYMYFYLNKLRRWVQLWLFVLCKM